jgi:hypothetical protein
LNLLASSVRRAAALTVLLGAVAIFAVVRAPSAAAAVACGAPAGGMASVAVVVDTGSAEPVVRCVMVREGATGRDALLAAGLPFRVGSGTPADNNQGGAFLCGILGIPQTGCAAPSSKGYSYWAYYRQPAGSAWTYSRVGFFTPVGSRCWVEGWLFTSSGGVAAADNPRPRVAPAEVACSSPAPPATTPAPPKAPVPTTAQRPTAASGGASAAPTVGSPTTAAAPTTAPAAQVEGRTAEGGTGEPAAATPSSTAPGSSAERPAASAIVDPPIAERATGANRSTERSGTSGGVPWVAVGAVIVAGLIGVGAFLRGRRAE